MTTYRSFRWLALAASIFTFGLVVVGGIVRVTGSGMGCGDDWPLCHGQLIPLFDLATFIEWSHRLLASLTSIFIVASAALATLRYRSEKWLFRPTVIALVLLVVQILLGAVTVKLELPPVIVAVHLANALLILAFLILATLFAFRPRIERQAASATEARYRRLVWASTLGTLALIVSGAVVTGTTAYITCATWPLCNNEIIPAALLPQIAMAHRVVAALIGALIAYTFFAARKASAESQRAGIVAAALFIAQIIVSVVMVQTKFDIAWRLLHLAASTAVWGAMVVLLVLAYQTPQAEKSQLPNPNRQISDPKSRSAITNYFLLTKPWIVALLLVTTLGAMLVAARGLPPLDLVLFTLFGGACAAGGANALNSYADREKDKQMGRTSQRPLPTGRVTPRAALTFAIILCALSIATLYFFVNTLSALLALIGIVYYSGIYTLYLKPRTPQNVVIGGAAGAIPPLVGYAAVTNDINLLAIYLFLIIFYWTPPHTWALMLMVAKDYERVEVPMMPVARGEQETRRQIWLYSLLLIVITLLPFAFGGFTWFYFIAALILGIYFLYLAFIVLRDQGKQSARKLYRFSNAYLALMFLVMVIDRSLIGI